MPEKDRFRGYAELQRVAPGDRVRPEAERRTMTGPIFPTHQGFMLLTLFVLHWDNV